MKLVQVTARILGAITAVNLWWCWQSRRQSSPYPTWLTGSQESPLMDKLIGTQTPLDRIGLQLGHRVLEVRPKPGRLLSPAARRALPITEIFSDPHYQSRATVRQFTKTPVFNCVR